MPIGPTCGQYMSRALNRRVLGELDGAIADYSRAIELDPHNADAWKFRGASKAQKASYVLERARKLEMLGEAHPDYQRAAELRPDDEQAQLALLELEICAGKYREAVGTTGALWARTQQPSNKVICAWLGAIAFILAGRPEVKWAPFREFLERDRAKVGETEWSVAEIAGTLRDLEKDRSAGSETVEQAKAIHALFLRHFEGRPAIG